jgi:dimethylamine---corrinoid protein Co-methyltransferase
VGSGDAFAMPIAHSCASGLGGMRAAGDLVARMQMARGMRLGEAKDYVAGKLGVTPFDLADPVLMNERRGELGLGRVMTFEMSHPDEASAIEAKGNIGDLLGLEIPSVRLLEERLHRQVRAG